MVAEHSWEEEELASEKNVLTLQVGLSIKSRTVRARLLHKKKITRQKSASAQSTSRTKQKLCEERAKANLTLSGMPPDPGGPCGAPVRAQARFTNTCKNTSRCAGGAVLVVLSAFFLGVMIADANGDRFLLPLRSSRRA